MFTADFVSAALLWAAQRDVWAMMNALVVMLSAVLGFSIFFWSKRRIHHLNFYMRALRDGSDYPHKIYLEIRNYTGRSVVLSSPYFRYKGLRRDPNSRGDTPSGDYEVKFRHPSENQYTEVEYLIRNKEVAMSWIPIDPTLSDEEVEKAIERSGVGLFTCVCIWLEDKPKIQKLKRKI